LPKKLRTLYNLSGIFFVGRDLTTGRIRLVAFGRGGQSGTEPTWTLVICAPIRLFLLHSKITMVTMVTMVTMLNNHGADFYFIFFR